MRPSRSVLISGCSSGIGYATAVALRQRGWRVFAGARRDDDLRRLRDEGLEAVQLDVDEPASIAAAVETVLASTGGHLDALFNNAGFGQPGAVEDLTREALRAQFETNLFGAQELTNQVLPVMRRQGHGRIVYNSSVLGFAALPYRGAYVASKFAMEGLVDTLRMELRGTGIAVALVEPGPIVSRFRANAHARYLANIDAGSSAHARAYRAMEHRLTAPDRVGGFTLDADAVARKVQHALESRRPRPRYYVTVPTWLFGILRRGLSTGLMDRVLLAATRGERQPPDDADDPTR
ncbi:SDR family NAD(P)-dependent oxidoreductase [Aquisalimonas asiatica]|uniref:Short-chain dehydrogenase n=1 Tax=Aquisalimonas asiatica TaxID=406100 RepID=A0A1H8U2M0_9GAMM|nr:SDR family NAD(P)-dependent oxidoreductase [Aquisalimonas asiatica]SEO97401.1 Short-chain dehydrogenase [Aquisalimonas asiatica]